MSRVNPCAIEGSLVRLCLERVDIFHLHNAITETGGGGEALSVRQVLGDVVPAFERGASYLARPLMAALFPPSACASTTRAASDRLIDLFRITSRGWVVSQFDCGGLFRSRSSASVLLLTLAIARLPRQNNSWRPGLWPAKPCGRNARPFDEIAPPWNSRDLAFPLAFPAKSAYA
jgi:hypothetical protein